MTVFLAFCRRICSRRLSHISLQALSSRILPPRLCSIRAGDLGTLQRASLCQARTIFGCFHPQRLLSSNLVATQQLPGATDGVDRTNKPPSTSELLPDTQSLSEEVEEPTSDAETASESIHLTCSGCGVVLQTTNPTLPGFIPHVKVEEWKAHTESDTETEVSSDPSSSDPPTERTSTGVVGGQGLLVCRRCFSLKHYNTALNITLKADDYKRHLSQLKDKRALILLMIDVADFPGSIFPDLHTLLSLNSQVMIIANKMDLYPKGLTASFWQKFRDVVKKECSKSSLHGCNISNVHFISAKTGEGVGELANDITENWGNRGDVYLLGCTNVGKSTLFNELLVLLCGARPGQLNTDSRVSAPMATISQWPGTTLGLLSFPIMSVGKRQRLLRQAQRREEESSHTHFFEEENLEELAFDCDEILTPKEAKEATKVALQETELDSILEEIGVSQKKTPHIEKNASPLNRFWLYDTPGAINDSQLINHLTTQELKLALPKKSIKPRTFILKPGQCLFVGGLARLDYENGPVSAYFTVFAASYLPVHVSKIDNADRVYTRNVGTQLLKIPTGDVERIEQFPPLDSQNITVHGLDWKHSAADVVLSSAGWVAVTIGHAQEVHLRAFTPLGKGIYVRRPSIFPEDVNKRGKRSQKGNRSSFRGQ